MGTHRGEQALGTATEGIDILPLEVRGLTFVVGGQVLLDGISFDLEAGSLACIIGPNGAGKSLLLRLCHGLLRPSAGTVRWAGGTLAQQQRAQAMVFQRPVLLRRSVRANVEHALAVRGCERVERRERALAVLEKTGLADKTGRDARVLSGGEQQRLALARAWVLQPQVLFLDEPTAHLDPAATRAVEDIISRIDASGTRIMMVSHDLGQVRRLASEVLFMHSGQLAERARAERFLDNPASEAGKAFLEGRLLW